MAKKVKLLLLFIVLILTSVLVLGIALPNKYESQLSLNLPINSGTAFRILSQFENYPAWYLISYEKEKHLSWITGLDGTMEAVLHWETARLGYERGQTQLRSIQPLTHIELISHSLRRNQRLTVDSFSIKTISHHNVEVIWNRQITLQFPYNITYSLKNYLASFKEDHRLIKEQFFNFYPEFAQ